MIIDAVEFAEDHGGHGSWSNTDRQYLFNQLIQKHHSGDWDCAWKVWERDRKISCAGLSKIIRQTFTRESLVELARKKYGGDLTKAVSYITKRLSPQLNLKFPEIYAFNKNNYNALNLALNTQMVDEVPKTVSKMSLSEKFSIASKISKEIENLSPSDRQDILEMITGKN